MWVWVWVAGWGCGLAGLGCELICMVVRGLRYMCDVATADTGRTVRTGSMRYTAAYTTYTPTYAIVVVDVYFHKHVLTSMQPTSCIVQYVVEL